MNNAEIQPKSGTPKRVWTGLPVNEPARLGRRLRICIATSEFGGTPLGEIGAAYLALAQALAARGHEVTCLNLQEPGLGRQTFEHWARKFKTDGLKFVQLPAVENSRLEVPAYSARSIEAYFFLKKNGPFDVVHFPDSPGAAYHTLLAKRQGLALAQTQVCVGAYGASVWRGVATCEFFSDVSGLEVDFMERQSVAMADVVVSPTEYMLDWMTGRGWTLPARSHFQQQVLSRSARASKTRGQDECSPITELVFFSRLETRQGLNLFCDALDRLPAETAAKIKAVTFLGETGVTEGVSAKAYINARSRRWSWKTEIKTDLPREQALEYLRGKGRLAVVPSILENSPYTILECLGAGIPFVASRVGGIAELIAAADLDRVCFEPKPATLAAIFSKAAEHGFQPARPAVDFDATEKAWVAWHESQPRAESAAGLPDPNPWPKLTVCMNTFNRPKLLAHALDGVRNLDYPNYDVVLVNGGSTQPEALQMLRDLEPEFAQRGWKIVHMENRYLGAARNVSVRHATGEFVLFMDDDNVSEPWIAKFMVKAALNMGADVVTSGNQNFTGENPPDRNVNPRRRWMPVGGSVARGVFDNCFGDANALMRRSTFEALGGFTEDFGIGNDDWELFAKAILKGYRLTVVPEFLFWYRYTQNSMTRQVKEYETHERSMRPYLEAIPEPLRDFVYFLRGQHLRFSKLSGRHPLESLEARLTVEWRSRLEAARIFVRENKNATAIALLMDAVKAIENSKHPFVIFDALCALAQEMHPLDAGRANKLLQLALQLSKALEDEQRQATVTALIASLSANQGKPARQQPEAAIAPRVEPAPVQTSAPVPAAPCISVVIPCYKQADLLPEAVESVLAQTFTDFEIIIVNDGSPDNTSDVARGLIAKFPGKRIRLIEKPNGGLASARNAGFAAAQGKYVLPLDADDRIKPAMLEKLKPILDGQPKVGFAYAHIQHFGDIDTEFPLPDFNAEHLVNKDNIAVCCALVRKSTWEQVGGYNESMREGYEDWDFWIGCVEHGWVGHCLHEPLFLYRKHGKTMLGEANNKRERLIARIVLNHPKLYDDATKRAARQLLDRVAASQTSAASPAPANPAVTTAEVPNRRSLRITYLISSILGVTGGNQTLLRQAEEMRRRGHDVTIVTCSPKPDWFKFETKVVQVPQGKTMASCVPPSHVVVATYFVNAPELRAVNAPVKVYYAQGDQFVFEDNTMADTELNRQLRTLSRASYQMPGVRFVANSRNLACAVERLSGRKADAILPVCTDQTIFRPLERSVPGSRFRLLIVGPDSRGSAAEPLLFKGIQDIHDALQILAKRYPHFTAVRMSGTPPEIFAKFPCEFYMAPSDEMKTMLFGTSHIHIYASHYDSCPRPPQEAMAAGCAVVCTATPGAMEYCRDGENSLLVPVKSPEAIADAVERLIKDHALREKLAQGGLATAREFPREREWDEWENILRKFVDQAGGTAAKTTPAKSQLNGKSTSSKPQAKAAAIKLPACALVGHLGAAREHFKKKNLRPAWEATLAAIQSRPFHPEGHLLLAEIAQAAGDSVTARNCAQQAVRLAPEWKPAKQFLKGNLRGNTKPEWMKLPQSAGENPSRISVCLITKNEEKFLGQCLASVHGLADQIVVVDTGSTDRTVEIAREHGAEVHQFAWCDDFSAARNFALEHATGDWVLMLDADEELIAEHRETIRREIGAASVMAYRLPIIDKGREQDGCSYVPRLFRNAPGLFYVGRVHEQVFSSIEVRRAEWGMENRLAKSALLHHGYVTEVVVSRDKIARNLRLLELAIKELPDEPNLLMNYGLELVRSDRVSEGLDQYRAAFRALCALPEEQVVPELRESLLTQFVTHLTAAGRAAEIIEICQSAPALASGPTATLHFHRGLAHMDLKQPAEAAEQMRQCLAKRNQPALSPINKEILKAGPHHCLALCLSVLKQTAEAEKAFRAALADDPHSRPARFDFARFQVERGEPVEALKLLHELAKQNPQDSQVWQFGGQVALSRPDFLEFAHNWTVEALKQFPDDPVILLQHAEVLLLAQNTERALPLWTRAHSPKSPRHLAALVLCELAAGNASARQFSTAEEAVISREFLKWYRQLISYGAANLVLRLNENLAELRGTLPSAAATLDGALKQARPAVTA